MERTILNKNKSVVGRFAAVLIYSIAMGYLESAVVIYLRETAFGNRVQVFPLAFLEPRLGQIEFIREAATIVMLLAIGYLAGRNIFQKCMFFVFSFAVWDIFYYLFLMIFTGWPGSLGDFDVLFLIPVIWISPVAAPVLISLLLTLMSTILIFMSEDVAFSFWLSPISFGIFVVGAATDFYSFTEQSFRILLTRGIKGLEGFTPVTFDWLMFWLGFLLMSAAAIMIVIECRRRLKTGIME